MNLWKQIVDKFSCNFKGDFINPYFQIALKKHCCEEITHRPTKMMMCEDVETDLLGTILPNAIMDGIFTAWSLKKETAFNVTAVEVHNKVKIYDHFPISCKVNGVRILSWNMSGRCNPQYNKGQHEARLKNAKMFIQNEENAFDVWCIQNFYSRKRIAGYGADSDIFKLMPSSSSNSYAYETYSSYNKDFIVFYDGYTDAIVVRKSLIDPKRKIAQLIPRYNDSSKKVSVVYINSSPPFYLANIHLKSPKKSKPDHDMELANILDTMNSAKCFETGAVLIGSFNRTNPEIILSKTKKNNYKSNLSNTRRKTV